MTPMPPAWIRHCKYIIKGVLYYLIMLQHWTGLYLGFCSTLKAWSSNPITYYLCFFLQLLAPKNTFLYLLIQHQSRMATGPKLNVILNQASYGLQYSNILCKLNMHDIHTHCMILIKPAIRSIFITWQEKKVTRSRYIYITVTRLWCSFARWWLQLMPSKPNFVQCRAGPVLCFFLYFCNSNC